MDFISKKICIKNYKCYNYNQNWGMLTGITNEGYVEYNYIKFLKEDGGGHLLMENGGYELIEKNSNIGVIPILFTCDYDDIGFGTSIFEYWYVGRKTYVGETIIYENKSYVCDIENEDLTFEQNKYTLKFDHMENGNTINFIGESRIDEFRRYGKTNKDIDLYNPTWNTGYTQQIIDKDGFLKQITNEKTNKNTRQNLYDYILGADPNNIEDTAIKFSDISNIHSNIEYKTNGLNSENSITTPIIKINHLLGVIYEPKINSNIFIDRSINSSFEKHLKMSEIRSLDDLTNYGNGQFKINEE